MKGRFLPIALLGVLVFPAPAQAAKESFMVGNAALRADYAYALHYWGRKPAGTTCGEVRVSVTNWPWAQGQLGDTIRLAKFTPYVPFCETMVRYGIGRCLRRITVIHEVGHELGLRFNPHPKGEPEHSIDPQSVMFPAMKVVWAEHPEFCPWAAPLPLPPDLDEWIEAEEEWS
jgi:hypothetical protein